MTITEVRKNRLPRFVDRLALGEQGLRLSPFCLGLVQSPDTVPAAFDAGLNFFFVTTDMHWPLYEATRRGLRKLLARRNTREQIVVGAVCYLTQPGFCAWPYQELLEAIPELGRLDVLIAGGVYENEFAGRLPVYQQHGQSGFVGCRAIGASFHDRRAARSAMAANTVDKGPLDEKQQACLMNVSLAAQGQRRVEPDVQQTTSSSAPRNARVQNSGEEEQGGRFDTLTQSADP